MRVSLTTTAVFAMLFAVACNQNTSPIQPSPMSGASSGNVTTSAVNMAGSAEHTAVRGQVPFKGTLEGDDVDSGFTPTTVDVTTTGTGNSTHLGRFSFIQKVTVTFATSTATGAAHFTAANGDRIDTTIAASGKPMANGELSITDVHTIIGGTGRFMGAQGSFTTERIASPVTFTTSGSFDGTITSPGAAH